MEGLGRRAAKLCLRFVSGSTCYLLLALLDLLARRYPRGPSACLGTLLNPCTPLFPMGF